MILPLVFLLLMRYSAAAKLLAFTRDTESWESKLVVPHNNESLDISSAAKGSHSKTPVGAPNQPKRHPLGSVYRFDIKFKGLESWPFLKDMLSGFQRCPGCKLSTTQSKGKRSLLRGGSWSVTCTKTRPQTKSKDGAFLDGQHAMSNIPVQHIKKVKSKGSTYKGVEGMYSKTVRAELRQDKKRKASAEDSSTKKRKSDALEKTNKRMMASRALDSNSTCPMGLNVFHDLHDNYFYLSTSSNLQHKYHDYIPPAAIPRNEHDLNENDLSLINILYNLRASNTMISQIFVNVNQ